MRDLRDLKTYNLEELKAEKQKLEGFSEEFKQKKNQLIHNLNVNVIVKGIEAVDNEIKTRFDFLKDNGETGGYEL